MQFIAVSKLTKAIRLLTLRGNKVTTEVQTTENAIERGMTIKERVMRALQSYGTQEVYASLSDIAAKTGRVGAPSLEPKQVYIAVWGLAQEGKLDIMTEGIKNTQRKQFSGVKLRKAENVEKPIEKSAEKVRNGKAEKAAERVQERFPLIFTYTQQKVAVQRAKEILESVHLPSDQIQFEDDPLAEEAVAILHDYVETLREKIELETQLAAANSELRFFKEQRQPIAAKNIMGEIQ